ncbi:MAG: LptF/LptG family permease [Bryobacterales bacterium]|nr:LptF/LptG family permease [Bryobacteraceae bacterium]MDW8130207.1 LptF/LptG family permease [Bryobacterales bacterium]
MGILARAILREIAASASTGIALFSFVLILQRLGSGKLFELLVRASAPAQTVAWLFLLVLPPVLVFTLPVGVLVGTLIVISRMSSDGEITGLRAAGVPVWRILPAVAVLGVLGMVLTALCSLWLTPAAIRETYAVLNRLAASQITAEIRPRVFEEQFPDAILYVADVVPGPAVRWRKVFLADQRSTAGQDKGELPRVTLAREAVAIADAARQRVQLSLIEGSTHEVGKDPAEYLNTYFPRGEQTLAVMPPGEIRARAYSEMDTGSLLAEAAHSIEARIELHQRLALPLACPLLALLAVPLGASSRKGGRSSAVVLTVALAFLYYMGLISLIGLARQGSLPVAAAVWTPNVVLALTAGALGKRLERPGEGDWLADLAARAVSLRRWVAPLWRRRGSATAGARDGRHPLRFSLAPQILDTYVLSSFLFYFAVLLAAFVLMTHVFTFFELLGDIVRNRIPMSRVLTYHVFLTPKLIYDAAPAGVLAAVLVTFGILGKHNEITAFKACGISLRRLAAPVLVASLLISVGLFAFDHYHVVKTNRIQHAIRNEIKGRPVQTFLRPDRKWIVGRGNRIYYYKHFDPVEAVMVGLSVYELDWDAFRLRRQIWAERARWSPAVSAWVFENGWVREIPSQRRTRFIRFQASTFPGLDEPPGYFLKEVKQDEQMNFRELAAYIAELEQSGFDTTRLRVQFFQKFSTPAFALVMALISVPFAFLSGPRGAMAGVGVSLGIAMAYWAVTRIFEQAGNLNQLPAWLAAFSPGAIFALVGAWLMTRMRT